MNRLEILFKQKPKGILSFYVPSGYPVLDSMPAIVEGLATTGVDLFEIGIPYSDPLADGPVIQACHQQALENGFKLKHLMVQLKELRSRCETPLVLMSYLNPALAYGFQSFCEDVAAAGIDGLILPDLPLDVYQKEYKQIVEANGLEMIFLVTPQTPAERIRAIDDEGKGFIYAVSNSSTTGGKKGMNQAYLKRLAEMNLRKPFLVGFGIAKAADFEEACQNANGAIIGSALIKAIQAAENPVKAAAEFSRTIRVEAPISNHQNSN